MSAVRVSRLYATIMLAGLLAGCTDKPATEPPAPVPGELTVRFATPNAGDGAAIITIDGPDPITEIELVDKKYTLFQRSTATGFKAAIFGDLGSGPLLKFMVPDVGEASKYSGTVAEVADTTNLLRDALKGYTVLIVQ